MSTTHARHQLAEIIHAPTRFSIVAALASTGKAEFAAVRGAVEISDSTLSQQASALAQAGYVKVTTGYAGKRPRTWLSLTPTGREAFTRHLEALRRIAEGG